MKFYFIFKTLVLLKALQCKIQICPNKQPLTELPAYQSHRKRFFDFRLVGCIYRNRDRSEMKKPASARIPVERDSTSSSHRQSPSRLQRQQELRYYTDSWLEYILCIECI